MTPIELAPDRLRALTLFSQVELSEITESVIRGTSEMIDAIATSLAGGDLEAVVQAAHRGRNEALLVGARELERAFAAAERAARRGQAQPVSEALESARALWPETRAAIEGIRIDPLR